MTHPDWVLKYKRKGTLVQKKRDNLYYLYRVHSKWNKEKGRAQLITDEYLGRITPDGLIEPKAKRIMKRFDQVTVKEYGATFLIQNLSSDIMKALRENFHEWKEIFVFAAMRLIHASPMKNVEFLYRTSYLSESLQDSHVSPDSLGKMIRNIGMDRGSMVRFMQSLMKGSRYMALDLTHVLSMSEGIISATLGHNSTSEFLPQVQLALLFSLDHEVPSYFRVLPSSINSAMSLKETMDESRTTDVVLVADTGFYSAANVKSLESMKLSYIIPLKRSSKLIDYSFQTEKHFMFHDQPIFYSKYERSGRTMYTFRNDFLKAEEEKDYLRREKSSEKFKAIRERMGTISVITNLKVSGEIVYDMLKSRMEVEQAYDTFKNTIHADRSYMRDDHQMQGWMFVNFIALVMHYRIYAILRKHDALSRYSVHDVIEHLERVQMLRIGEEWKLSEIPKQSRILIEKIGIPIM
jgi:transposase